MPKVRRKTARRREEQAAEEMAIQSGADLYDTIVEVLPNFSDVQLEVASALQSAIKGEPMDWDDLSEDVQDFFIDLADGYDKKLDD